MFVLFSMTCQVLLTFVPLHLESPFHMLALPLQVWGCRECWGLPQCLPSIWGSHTPVHALIGFLGSLNI